MMAAILKILRFANLPKKTILFGVENDRKCQFLAFDAEMRANAPHRHLKSIQMTFGYLWTRDLPYRAHMYRIREITLLD